MIDNSVVRMHQNGACVADKKRQDIGRSQKSTSLRSIQFGLQKAGDLSSAGFF
jgi:hypothetical protein